MSKLEWIDIKNSSQIEKVAFDYKTEDLYIEFTNGSKYVYYKCEVDAYKELISAPSAGVYFHNNIKGVLTFNKVGND